jgi:hypothetical protein
VTKYTISYINTPDIVVVVVVVAMPELHHTAPAAVVALVTIQVWHHHTPAVGRQQEQWHYHNQPVAVADILAAAVVVGIRQRTVEEEEELRHKRWRANVEEHNNYPGLVVVVDVKANHWRTEPCPNHPCRASLFLLEPNWPSPMVLLLLQQHRHRHHFALAVVPFLAVDVCAFHNCRHLYIKNILENIRKNT